MYEILGKYKGEETEVLDEAETREEARFLCQEYRIAFGPGWQISVRRARRR